MKKDIKARWVKALESGKYKQTTGALRDKNGYCCLGVLCDLYRQQKKMRWNNYQSNIGRKGFLGDVSYPSPKVLKWAGLKDKNPKVAQYGLSIWNDELKANFKTIAQLIRREL